MNMSSLDQSLDQCQKHSKTIQRYFPPFRKMATNGWNLARMCQVAKGVSRDLDMAEIFSGRGNIHGAGLALGLKSVAFDKLLDPSMDIMTEQGMAEATRTVARVREGGWCHIAPDCRSFCGLCCANSKRTKANPDGSGDFATEGNIQADRAALLFEFGAQRNVDVTMENPEGNFFWQRKSIVSLLHRLGTTRVKVARCRFQAPGPRYKKIFRIEGLTRHDWIRELQCECKCKQPHESLATVQEVKKADGRIHKQTTGKGRDLKESGAYPYAMASKMVQKWQAAPGSVRFPGSAPAPFGQSELVPASTSSSSWKRKVPASTSSSWKSASDSTSDIAESDCNMNLFKRPRQLSTEASRPKVSSQTKSWQIPLS